MRTDIGPGIFTVSEVLTLAECREYIAWSELLGYEGAPVSLAGGPTHLPDIRNNARAMIDAPERAQELWLRIMGELPPTMDGRHAVGLNERLRFYRYGPGQRFAPHTDGCFRRPNGDESLFTVMVYLNEPTEGGETRFENATVVPVVGLALIFDHYLLHEGAPVLKGKKYVLRTDAMYGPVAAASVV
jgi:prolyl 4-hydroxylase